MAKRKTRKAGRTVDALGDFAEELGRVVGTTERKGRKWLGQRKNLVKRLTQVRNKATQLLAELDDTRASAVDSMGRAIRRRLQSAGKAGQRSGAARKKVTAAKRRKASVSAAKPRRRASAAGRRKRATRKG